MIQEALLDTDLHQVGLIFFVRCDCWSKLYLCRREVGTSPRAITKMTLSSRGWHLKHQSLDHFQNTFKATNRTTQYLSFPRFSQGLVLAPFTPISPSCPLWPT